MSSQPYKLRGIDLYQCQAVRKDGTYFKFGRDELKRCICKPTVVAYENNPGPDGVRGAMSLCDPCCGQLTLELGKSFVTVVPIPILLPTLKQRLPKPKRRSKRVDYRRIDRSYRYGFNG